MSYEWIAKDTTKRCNMKLESKLIKESCAVTCGLREETTGEEEDITYVAPTTAPTKSPTNSPVSSTSKHPVGNDNNNELASMLLYSNTVKKCKWVAKVKGDQVASEKLATNVGRKIDKGILP